MTGWHITIGYNSGHITKADAWETLKTVVSNVCSNRTRIGNTALGYGCPQSDDAGTLAEHLEKFAIPCPDATITLLEPNSPGDAGTVMLLASATSFNSIKTNTRRAFARLVIQEMHKRQIDVDLSVV